MRSSMAALGVGELDRRKRILISIAVGLEMDFFKCS